MAHVETRLEFKISLFFFYSYADVCKVLKWKQLGLSDNRKSGTTAITAFKRWKK